MKHNSTKNKGICPMCNKNYDNSNFEKDWELEKKYLFIIGNCQHCGAEILEGYELTINYNLTTGIVR